MTGDLDGDLTSSPWVWWYQFVANYIAIVFAIIGLCLCFGPARWTHGNTLQVLRDHVHIPWPIIGGLFLGVAVGLCIRRLRLGAYLLGAFLACVFVLMSILFSIAFGRFTNPITVLLSTLAIPMMLAGIRYTVVIERRSR